MIEFLSTHFDTLLAFITGGGLMTAFTVRYSRQKASADAMKSVQEVYQTTIKDLQADKDLMKAENKEMRYQVSELKKTVEQNTHDINELRTYKCIVVDCKRRNSGGGSIENSNIIHGNNNTQTNIKNEPK